MFITYIIYVHNLPAYCVIHANFRYYFRRKKRVNWVAVTQFTRLLNRYLTCAAVCLWDDSKFLLLDVVGYYHFSIYFDK